MEQNGKEKAKAPSKSNRFVWGDGDFEILHKDEKRPDIPPARDEDAAG